MSPIRSIKREQGASFPSDGQGRDIQRAAERQASGRQTGQWMQSPSHDCEETSSSHQRRRLLGFAVTEHPTAEWLARQITEAFPWDTAPKYLIRDNDRAFGGVFKARVHAMGIRDQPTSYRSPLAERIY